MPTSNYKNLRVWQSAMDLVVLIQRLADQIPGTERNSLACELRSAALSVPVKIAIGNSRFARAEYLECITIAQSALIQISILLQIAARLGCLRSGDVTEAEVLADHTLRMLATLATRLDRREGPTPSRADSESSSADILPLTRRTKLPQR